MSRAPKHSPEVARDFAIGIRRALTRLGIQVVGKARDADDYIEKGTGRVYPPARNAEGRTADGSVTIYACWSPGKGTHWATYNELHDAARRELGL